VRPDPHDPRIARGFGEGGDGRDGAALALHRLRRCLGGADQRGCAGFAGAAV
jgi:hypothetical protein